MPYGTPEHTVDSYVANVVSADGVQVSLTHRPFPGPTEAQRDAAFQAALDAIASLPGWTFAEGAGAKQYGGSAQITLTED